jgi:tetratricopeptide (TPR) repeat protein
VSAGSERRGIPLEHARTDGWLDKLANGSPNFEQLREIFGERALAFAVIAGVQITAVTYDRRAPDASVVEFAVGDQAQTHQMPLGELRRRLATAMLEQEQTRASLPEQPTARDIQEFIGFRYVLLAPLFGLRLEELRLGDEESSTVVVEDGEATHELPLEEFREWVRDGIRGELEAHAGAGGVPMDLEVLPEVERASEEGQWEQVIDKLQSWPTAAAMLMRTPQGQGLSPEVKRQLAHALGVLGTAYARMGQPDWGEEVMRLGIQWGQDQPVAGELFRRLGESYVARQRHGEAVGLLRRGLTLGSTRAAVLPLLARCYAARGRYVAAMACAEEAATAGAPEEQLAAVRSEARSVLGEAWDRFREHVPAPASDLETVPPPHSTSGPGS